MGKLVLVWIVLVVLSLILFENLWAFFIVFSSIVVVPFLNQAFEYSNFNIYDHVGKGAKKRREYLKRQRDAEAQRKSSGNTDHTQK